MYFFLHISGVEMNDDATTRHMTMDKFLVLLRYYCVSIMIRKVSDPVGIQIRKSSPYSVPFFFDL